jgi:RNA polymerase sigma factor (sigma-70 family)
MDRTYDSLDSYINLAKKTIVKFGPRFYNGLSAEMLKNTDAVSDVATAIMYADWRFDPDRPGKSGQKKTLYSYRNQCAIWAIKTYVTNKYKKQINTSISLNFSEEGADSSFYSSIADEKAMDPVDILIDKEESNQLTSSIDQLLNNSILSEKQKIQIKMYYLQNHTLSYIGKKFGVSREAIRQNIKRALDIIRSYDKCTT